MIKTRESFKGINRRDVVDNQSVYDSENILYDGDMIPRSGQYKARLQDLSFNISDDIIGDGSTTLTEDMFYGEVPLRVYRYKLLRSDVVADIVFTKNFVFAMKLIGYNTYDITCLNEKSITYSGMTKSGVTITIPGATLTNEDEISSFLYITETRKFHRINTVVSETEAEIFTDAVLPTVDSGYIVKSIMLDDNISIVEWINENEFEKTLIFCTNSGFNHPTDGVLYQIMPDLTMRRLDTVGDETAVPRARYLSVYNNQLLCGYIYDTGIEYPTSIAFGDIASETNFSSGSAGKIDLATSDGEITGIATLNNRVYAFKQDNISILMQTGDIANPLALDEAAIKEGGYSPVAMENKIYFYTPQYGIGVFDGSAINQVGYRVEQLCHDKYSNGFYCTKAEEGYVLFGNRIDKTYTYKNSPGNLAYNPSIDSFAMYDKYTLASMRVYVNDATTESFEVDISGNRVWISRPQEYLYDTYDDGSATNTDYYCYFTTRDDYGDRKSDKRVMEIQLTGMRLCGYYMYTSETVPGAYDTVTGYGTGIDGRVTFAPQYVAQMVFAHYRFQPNQQWSGEPVRVSRMTEMFEVVQQDNYR